MVSRIVMKMVMDPKYMEKSWSRTNFPTSLSSIPIYYPNRVFANPRYIKLLMKVRFDTADKQNGEANEAIT